MMVAKMDYNMLCLLIASCIFTGYFAIIGLLVLLKKKGIINLRKHQNRKESDYELYDNMNAGMD